MATGTERALQFRCTACRGVMTAPRAATGRLATCPSCGASILVPDRSMRFPPETRRRLLIGTGAGLLAVLLLNLAARLLAHPDPVPPRPAAVPAVAVTGSERGTAAAADSGGASIRQTEPTDAYRELQAAHRTLGRQYEELANWVLSNMRGRFLLKERFVRNLELPTVADGFAVHPDMLEFLEVSPRERDLLEDAMGYGLSTMASLEARFLSVTQSAPERVALHIPPYEREGAAMQEDLYRAMETVLGTDRFGRLLDAGERDLIKRYHYFGTAARTMIFTLTAADDPRDPPYLVIRDGWVIPDGPGKRSIQVAEASVREMPKDYLPYLSWLPEYMAAFVQP